MFIISVEICLHLRTNTEGEGTAKVSSDPNTLPGLPSLGKDQNRPGSQQDGGDGDLFPAIADRKIEGGFWLIMSCTARLLPWTVETG